MKFRQIISLTLLLIFALLMVTSIVLYVIPHGRVAYWANWSLWGMGKDLWTELHINSGVLFVFLSIIHTILNWKAITIYLKNKAKAITLFKGELIVAMILSIAVCLGTVWRWPPFSLVLDLNGHFKDLGDQKYGEPPYGHAELSTLKSFARKQGLDLARCEQRLQNAAVKFDNADQTLKEIALNNNMAPQQVYDLIKDAVIGSAGQLPLSEIPGKIIQAGQTVLPEEPPAGTGSKTLGQICSEFQLDANRVIAYLKANDIEAEAGQTIRAIATQYDKHPHDIYALIREGTVKD